MPRPTSITPEDLARWDKLIEEELDTNLSSNLLFREVCYAGQWLAEQLHQLNCSDEMIVRIIFTAGRLSFGRDPWEISTMLLTGYQNNELKYEDPKLIN
jgi:hypothetical protein